METIKAAICDDEALVLPYLEASLKDEFRKQGFSLEADTYTAVTPLWNHALAKPDYAIYFLDIDIPDYDGITAAERIRKLSSEAVIVFISAKEDLVFRTFPVSPAAFIRKDSFSSDCREAVRDICERFFKPREERVWFQDALGSEMSLDLAKVLYIEAEDKYVNIHEAGRHTLVRQTIARMEEVLGAYGFVRTHRSYLVNCRFLYRIGKDYCQMDDNARIPVSRYRMNQVKAAFCKYIV